MSLIKNIRAARALANTKKFTSATSSVVGKDNAEDMLGLVDSLLFSLVHDHEGVVALLSREGVGEDVVKITDVARQSVLRIVGKLPASLWDQISLGRKATAVRQILDAVEAAHMDVVDDFLMPAAVRWGFQALIAGDDAEVTAPTTTTVSV